VMFIDDVGSASFLRDSDRESLWSGVIDHCWRHQCCVVLTTNLSPEQFSAHVGERAKDRLKNMTGGPQGSGMLQMNPPESLRRDFP